ncbi:MAG: hypothetical protein KQH63_17670 [Desulfobulbaceae bacterium]|nr:hypothetical protein [Desulfobulbaceae bacterium]
MEHKKAHEVLDATFKKLDELIEEVQEEKSVAPDKMSRDEREKKLHKQSDAKPVDKR